MVSISLSPESTRYIKEGFRPLWTALSLTRDEALNTARKIANREGLHFPHPKDLSYLYIKDSIIAGGALLGRPYPTPSVFLSTAEGVLTVPEYEMQESLGTFTGRFDGSPNDIPTLFSAFGLPLPDLANLDPKQIWQAPRSPDRPQERQAVASDHER